ncbi:MAG: hypothetical protein ACFNM6_07425, partial [Prevotella sp.]
TPRRVVLLAGLSNPAIRKVSHHLLRKLIRGYGKVKPPASSYVGRAFPIFLGKYQCAEKWSKLYHQASIVVPQVTGRCG